ncbi:MAG: hypothetical protein COW79_16090 [Bdellovibrionales bacterium CG22_combo_CG10-13_8_21_14_all_38_13]|nr:MAG: hypothetical protein COW79_16090 [Bdellovibrionales bacterium CG22_combo_CG10-13_8_21_14_all_38_13]PIR33346.1 MAG: hypothetical protein COV36_02835 [Alphaproteobacteria bacterium CG11_big_fil_rev_8_21_14_0_20_44_7]
MTIIVKQISDRGTSNPIVARTGPQANEIFQWSSLSREEEKKFLLFDTLSNFRRRLLVCDDIRETVLKELVDINESYDPDEMKNGVTLPQIVHLDTYCEIFLYFSKLAMRDLSPIFSVFYDYDKYGHDYRKHRDWAKDKFGEDDELYRMLAEDHDWIKKISDLRNAVEHPENGKLNIKNIELHKSGKLLAPLWWKDGENKADILRDMHVFVENMLTFSEDLLVVLVKKTASFPHLIFLEIPEEERTPEMPTRITPSMDMSKLNQLDTTDNA